MGRIVIACFKPKPGKADALRKITKEHLPILRSQGLVTDREPIQMEAKDGTVIEVFEWKSAEAIESAHTNPVILKLWDEYAKVCEYIPVASVPESSQLFSEFTPLSK